MKTFDDLKREIEQQGGIAAVGTFDLRNLYGNKRLTRASADGISGCLSRAGMGHLPSAMPRGDTTVVVYVRGAPAGRLVQAITAMAQGRDLHASAGVVRAVATEPLHLLDKIRALVGPPSDGA